LVPAAFTLIEMLVVVTIIVILAALLLPALAKAKLQGRRISCLNNVRRMAISRKMYTDDNQGSLILSTATNEDSVDLTVMSDDPKVLICPSTHVPMTPLSGGWGTADTTYFGSGPNTPNIAGSYAINGWLSVNHTPVESFTPYFFNKEADLLGPATIPLFQDSTWYYIFPLETDRTLDPANLYTGTNGNREDCQCVHSMGLCLIERHSDIPPASAPRALPYYTGEILPGTINMAFADNHAELVMLNNLWNYTWHRGWETPRPHP
jgi:prepilin-type N-terminal cleavage/methylation domain-containing protein